MQENLATNQNQWFGQKSYGWYRTTPETFQKNFFQNICSNTEINANFHFSHYEYMETLSRHSNENTWATTIKNIFHVAANVMNIYAKFQLHHPYLGPNIHWTSNYGTGIVSIGNMLS